MCGRFEGECRRGSGVRASTIADSGIASHGAPVVPSRAKGVDVDEPAAEPPATADVDTTVRCPHCGADHPPGAHCPGAPAQQPRFIDTLRREREPLIFVPKTGSAYVAPRRVARIPYTAPRPVAWPRARGERARGTWRAALAFAGASIATIALFVCLAVAGVSITDIAKAGSDVRASLIATAISIGIGVASMLLMYWAARVYAKAIFAALAVVLVTGGLAMLVAAPIVRQMNTPELAEYRGFAALTWFGAVIALAGVALGAACVRWSMSERARRHLERWARYGGAIYGVALTLGGMITLLAMFSLIGGEAYFDDGGNEFSVVEQAVLFTASAVLLLVPGVLLVYHCISVSMGEGSAPFRAPVALVLVAMFAAVLGLGQLNMRQESPLALPMPLLHVLAGGLPGAAYVALAARGAWRRGVHVRGISWRQAGLAVAISTGVATMIAIYVESIGALYAVALLLVHNGTFAEARNADDVFEAIGDASLILTNNEQFVAGFVTAAVLAPLSEEFGKSLAVRFTMPRAATRAQAFLLGAAAGAGFGLLESQLYGLSGISDDLAGWWEIMVLRGGSTSLHVMCSGLAGLAWWYWSIAKRHRPALLLFAAAIAIHAGWNGFFTVLDSRIFGLEGLEDRTIELIAYTVVAFASVAMIFALPLIARRLREPPPPPADGTPLAVMTPWLG